MKETLFELLEKLMPKKHFICTHTFVSEDAKNNTLKTVKTYPLRIGLHLFKMNMLSVFNIGWVVLTFGFVIG